jgi:hypothetical protein
LMVVKFNCKKSSLNKNSTYNYPFGYILIQSFHNVLKVVYTVKLKV